MHGGADVPVHASYMEEKGLTLVLTNTEQDELALRVVPLQE